ncbi:hypothetical protein GCM10027048_20270 [Hymenobacter coalescens]
MNKTIYAVIPAALAVGYKGYSRAGNTFACRQTKAGQCVCAVSLVLALPELFNGLPVTFIELTPDDFEPLPVPPGLPGHA